MLRAPVKRADSPWTLDTIVDRRGASRGRAAGSTKGSVVDEYGAVSQGQDLHVQGDRTSAYRQQLFRTLDDERHARGPGPSRVDCLVFTGHTGVSVDLGQVIVGFNPSTDQTPTWQVQLALRNGGAFPGVVLDDTTVFVAARQRQLTVLTFDVILPDPAFASFVQTLNDEIRQSRYTYGFPDGDGECNCTTWLERLGLPLLTGRMDEFPAVLGVALQFARRFGQCN